VPGTSFNLSGQGEYRKVLALSYSHSGQLQKMNDAMLLDEVEQWLETHGTISGVPFSEHGLLERLREHRALAKQADSGE
jgi:hypothetical protein